MYKLTVQGETLSALGAALAAAAAQFSAIAVQEDSAQTQSKPAARGKGKGKETAADLEPQRPAPTNIEELKEQIAEDESAEDRQVLADLKAPADPMPATAKTVVDAGTGQPAPAATDETPVVKMTPAEVKSMAARLVAKDTAKLGEILTKYGATKISEVKPEQLGDFASDVIEALEDKGDMLS